MSTEALISSYQKLSPELQKAIDLFLEALVKKETLDEKPDQKREFGSVKGKLWMSDDFDAPLPEFEPYM